MKKVIPSKLQPGMIAAEPVCSVDNKQILVQAGGALTEKAIKLINNWDIPYVMIAEENELSNQLAIEPGAVKDEDLSLLPEIMAEKAMNFITTLDAVHDRVNGLLEDIRATGAVDLEPFREIAAQISRHLIQPAEAINKILFKSPPRTAHKYLTHHTVAVAALSGMLGEWMEIPVASINDLVLAGLLHDVGKTQLPRSLIADKHPTPERLNTLRQHVILTLKLLKDNPKLPASVLASAVQHHEHMDGSGYPRALSGDKIHLYARIMAVADRLTQIVSNSPSVDPFALAETIKGDMFSKLDPAVCDSFTRRFNDYLMNNPVRLNDGRKAKVVFLSNINSTCPVLQTDDDQFVDLTKNKEVKIEGIIF